MPNMRKPTLSAQVGSFMDTPERAALVKAWAQHLNITHGAIMREVMTSGLNAVVGRLQRKHGELPADLYEAILAAERQRGQERAAAGAAAKRGERVGAGTESA